MPLPIWMRDRLSSRYVRRREKEIKAFASFPYISSHYVDVKLLILFSFLIALFAVFLVNCKGYYSHFAS